MFRRLISMVVSDRSVRHSPARRVATPAARSQPPDAFFIEASLPPISTLGLKSIDNQSQYAHPMQLRRWIKEIEAQMDDMHPCDRELAQALLPKLRHLAGDR